MSLPRDDRRARRMSLQRDKKHARSLYDAISRDPSSFDQIITPLASMDLKMAVMGIAITENSAGIVQSFLDAGMINGSPQDVLKIGDSDLDEVLGHAVICSADAVVEVLLAARADPNKPIIYDGYMTSMIVCAIMKSDATVVKQLLDAKCDISSCRQGRHSPQSYPDRIPAICIAVRYGNDEIVSLILKANADVNAPNCFGNMALHLAVGHEQITRDTSTTIRMLVSGGALVDAENHRGHTPLEVACFVGRFNYIPLLLELGADPFRRECLLVKRESMRESILSLRPEATYFHVHPGIKTAALALALCRTDVDEAHPFCHFPPEMLIQLLHEMSCTLILGR